MFPSGCGRLQYLLLRAAELVGAAVERVSDSYITDARITSYVSSKQICREYLQQQKLHVRGPHVKNATNHRRRLCTAHQHYRL